MNHSKILTNTVKAALSITLFAGVAYNAVAHTRLETATIDESVGATGHGGKRLVNNVVIGHACGDGTSIIAHSVVFPDGEDSIIKVNGTQVANPVTDYIENYGNLNQKILSKAVFEVEAEKFDSLGNVVGFWTRDGRIPATSTAFIPFRHSAHVINPESCAKSVTVVLGIADICKVTNKAGFSDATVNLWTPAVGSDYDGVGMHGYNSPATYIVMRDLAQNPIPSSCSNPEGDTVEIIPSAAQMNRDMPIIKGTKQYWPKL